jgi:transposase
MARPAASFCLKPTDVETLQSWLCMGTLPQNLGQRARILLLLASGLTPKQVSDRLEVSAPVVFKWRKRYQEAGLVGLSDLPRSGHPRKLDEAKIKEILTLTTQRVPREATHWSLRLMAKYVGVTVWQVAQVWAAADLKPHRLKTFKISNDPHFAGKVVDVVGLYLSSTDPLGWTAWRRLPRCGFRKWSGVWSISGQCSLGGGTASLSLATKQASVGH